MENYLDLTIQRDNFLFLNNKEFVKVESIEIQYKKVKMGFNFK